MLACQPSHAPTIAISVTSPSPIASRPSARLAPARVPQTTPPATTAPTKPVNIASKRSPPIDHAPARTSQPTTSRPSRGHHGLAGASVAIAPSPSGGPSLTPRSGPVPTRHQTENSTKLATSAAGWEATQAPRSATACSSGPAHPSTSGRVSAVANGRANSAATGRSVPGASQATTKPARSPGIVTQSGITR